MKPTQNRQPNTHTSLTGWTEGETSVFFLHEMRGVLRENMNLNHEKNLKEARANRRPPILKPVAQRKNTASRTAEPTERKKGKPNSTTQANTQDQHQNPVHTQPTNKQNKQATSEHTNEQTNKQTNKQTNRTELSRAEPRAQATPGATALWADGRPARTQSAMLRRQAAIARWLPWAMVTAQA